MPNPTPGGHGGKLSLLSTAAALLLITGFLVRPEIRGFDGAGNYVYLLSLLGDGDLDFADDYLALDEYRQTPYRMMGLPSSPVTGRMSNQFGFGAALFWAPAVLVVHVVLSLFSPNLADGMTAPYAWAVALSTALWTSLGLLLLLARLQEQFGRGASILAVFGITFSTALVFYGWVHGSMSHGVSFFVAVLALLQSERTLNDRSCANLVILGALGGLLLVTRYQDIVWTTALGSVALLRGPSTGRGRVFGQAVCFASGCLVVLLPQMAVWNLLYGSWWSGPVPHFSSDDGEMTWLPINVLSVLISERGGVLAWHPVLLVSAVGLVLFRRRWSEPFFLVSCAGMTLQLYLVSCWSGWWGGASFGNRFFVSSYPWLAMGLAALLQAIHRRYGLRWTVAASLVFALWNAGLLVQYALELVPRSESVPWEQVLANQFTFVPFAVYTWAVSL